MKNLFIFSVILISSCTDIKVKKIKIKCAVTSCEQDKMISVHDEINKKEKWKVKTACGPIFSSTKSYKKGDSVEVIFVFKD